MQSVTGGSATRNQLEFSNREAIGEVMVKLSTRGTYSWSIKTLVMADDRPETVGNRLAAMDYQLQKTFPNYAKKSASKWQGM